MNPENALSDFRNARTERRNARTAYEEIDNQLAAALAACPEKCPIWGIATPAAAAAIRAEFRVRHAAALALEQKTFEAVGLAGYALARALNAADGSQHVEWCNPRVERPDGRCYDLLGWGIYDHKTDIHKTISQL